MKHKEFTFFWRDGERDVFPGESPDKALNNAGYGGGAVGALDFWDYGDSKKYWWDAKAHTWRNKELHPEPEIKL